MTLTESVDLQRFLVDVGAVKENDYRVSRPKDFQPTSNNLRSGQATTTEDEDDDWD